jgi:DNA-binding response OmpR family regulator
MANIVLTVDPDIVSWTATLDHVKAAGYETVTAHDFQLAIHLLATVRPGLLITVVRLGAYNGLHLVLRGRAVNPRMAAFVVGDSTDACLETECKELGATGYCTKPVPIDKLLALIAEALAERNRRHSSRLALAGPIVVRIGVQRARVVDVSHGGLRLEFEAAAGVPPTVLEIKLPNGISVKARCAWIQQRDRSDVVWCGAAVDSMTPQRTKNWRQLVQTLKGVELH